MFLPALVARSPNEASPPPCKPFTLHSNVCVGDMIAIIACSIAGIGFFFWSIHAIRKMRQFPSTYKLQEEKEEPNGENNGVDPFPVPSSNDDLVRHGISQTPSLPERVRTRMALTMPEEYFDRPSALAPISSDAYYGQSIMTEPRMPPRAGGPSYRTSRHGPLVRGGRYGEGYTYEPYGEYVGPSRARGSPAHMPSGDYGSHQSMSRMNREHITCAY